MNPEPHQEYHRRLASCREVISQRQKRDRQLASLRGIAFALFVAFLLCSFFTNFSVWFLFVPAVLFTSLVIWHREIVGKMETAKNVEQYYERCIRRVEDNWHGTGATGERYRQPNHPYTQDLDIFGDGSLFQLISTARTRLGEDIVAEWLSQPADKDELANRQAAVEELRNNLDLREELAVLDAQIHDNLDQKKLLAWSLETSQPPSAIVRILAVVGSLACLVMFFGWLVFNWRISFLMLAVVFQGSVIFSVRKELMKTLKTIDTADFGLKILSQVLAVLERQSFTSLHLQAIRESVETDKLPPSKHIVRLHNLVQYLNNSLQNQFFAPLAFVLGMHIHLLNAIEKWKEQIGLHITEWLDAVGEFEALCSFSGYAFEHPQNLFAKIVEGGPLFEGESLGHPLIPEDQCIRNDITLDCENQLLLISGSNMSGKSTLLRTVGCNVVLALAGIPVCAKNLQVSEVTLGTAMRINDSLLEGKSLFYAVVSRMQLIVELSGKQPPLLFLFDEILQGTNSHDRRIGSQGIIKNLVECGTVGMVTTHDLALTEIVDSLGERATNAHFEDHLEDGKMTFDYKLRPGVVQKSNALELMRMMGLKV